MPPATFDAFRDHGRPRASLLEDVDVARRHDGNARGSRHLHEGGHRQAARRRSAALFSDAFEKLLKAVEKQSQAGGSRKNQPPDVLAARAAGRRGDTIAGRSGGARARCAGSGSATRRSGAARTKAQWLGWLGITNDQLAHRQRLTDMTEAAEERRLLPRPAAGDGRIEPRSRSDQDDLRHDQRIPRAARARFHRPGAGQGVREQSRSRRTRSSSSRASRARRSSRTSSSSTSSTASQRLVGAKEAGQSVPRHHRSGLEDAAGRRARWLSPRLLRLAEHRRALLGALRFRPGAGGDHGRGRGQVPRPDRRDGLRLHAVGSRCRKTPASCSARSSAWPRSSSAATR